MRKVNKHLFNFIQVASIFSFVLFAVGFFFALQNQFSPSTQPIISQKANNTSSSPTGHLLVGLGDSLTRGIGDTEGEGYFGIVKNEIQKHHPTFQAINLGISGQTSHDLVKQLNQSQVRETIKKADWISITIGGNDLFRSTNRLENIDEKKTEKSRIQFEENLHTILATIQNENPQATVYLFGLYNPFGDLEIKDQAFRIVTEWNQTINQVTLNYKNVIVIHTYDLFQMNGTQLLYQDHFHPNRSGYQRMAERLLQHIEPTPKGETMS